MEQAHLTVESYERQEVNLDNEVEFLRIRLRRLLQERRRAKQKRMEAWMYFGRVKASIELAGLADTLPSGLTTRACSPDETSSYA